MKAPRPRQDPLAASIPLLIVALLTLAACSPTRQARRVAPSGFLGDLYAEMREGEGDEELLVYRSREHGPVAQRGPYVRVAVTPVEVWVSDDDGVDAEERADLQRLADAFHAMIREELARDLEVVGSGIDGARAPGTLLLEAALTDARESRPLLKIVSSVPAPMNFANMTSTAKGLLTGKRLFVGDVSGELRVSDAATGELLAASVDRRVGTRRLDLEALDSWSDVERGLRYWAQLIRYRMCQNRGAAACVEPGG